VNDVASSRRLVTFGEAMGLFAAAKPGRFGVDRAFTFSVGGAESNVAIGAARLGASVTWFGRVGSDSVGDHIGQLLNAEGVETLAVRDSGFTGLMVKHERFADATEVDYYRAGSAASRLSPDDIPHERLRGAQILHVTGITPALSGTARSTVFQAVELARQAGVLVSLDVNYRRKLWSPDDAAPVLRHLVSRSDIVFAGLEESDLVTGQRSASAREAVEHLARLGGTETIIKDGAQGCAARIDEEAHELPAISVRVIDPVGAGDAFVAGYLSERLLGADPSTRLRTAIQAGGLAVATPGDCESLPFRSDLLRTTGNDVTR
jgi:2-dehydro-3-deoxygluconokinase